MPVNGGESSSSSSSPLAPEDTKLRRPGNLMEAPDLNPPPRIVNPSTVQSRSSKAPTILHSGDPSPKKPFFPASKFRGMGCTAAASQQVSVPSAIRASADWERRKTKRNHKKGLLMSSRNRNQGLGNASNFGCNSSASCVVAEDAWCGPGIGFSDADSECVVLVGRRNVAAGRGKLDGQTQRERRPCITRRAINNSEHLCFLNTDPPPLSSTTRPVSEEYGRHHRHIRYSSPEGLDEVMMLHGGILLGDRHRGWRLDVDDMSYEQLLELGDRIGHVNTGLKEEEIGHCIGKIKISNIHDLQDYLDTKKTDGKCSICQEEYEEGEELGKLECGHGYHLECIKQWLSHKNRCPVCKTQAAAPASSS